MFLTIACRAGNFVNADANHRLRAAANTATDRLTGISLISGHIWPRRSGVERQLNAQAGTSPGRALEKDSAAHCPSTILEPEKAGAVVEVGTADAVVAYGDVKYAAAGVNCDGDTDG